MRPPGSAVARAALLAAAGVLAAGSAAAESTSPGVASAWIQQSWYFRRYPYEAGLPGQLWQPGHPQLAPERATPPGQLRDVSVQLTIEEGYATEGVHRPAAAVRFETRWLVGFEAGWAHFVEARNGGVDHFGTGTASILVHARWNRVTAWSGIGLRVLADPSRPDVGSGGAIGWNGSAGLRLYPVRPLLIDLRLDYGALSQAAVLHARGELGLLWRSLSPYVGYDYFSLGGVRFHGPLVGLRLFAY